LPRASTVDVTQTGGARLRRTHDDVTTLSVLHPVRPAGLSVIDHKMIGEYRHARVKSARQG